MPLEDERALPRAFRVGHQRVVGGEQRGLVDLPGHRDEDVDVARLESFDGRGGLPPSDGTAAPIRSRDTHASVSLVRPSSPDRNA
jgi:hypothetical protein